jgi:hypothetical protein
MVGGGGGLCLQPSRPAVLFSFPVSCSQQCSGASPQDSALYIINRSAVSAMNPSLLTTVLGFLHIVVAAGIRQHPIHPHSTTRVADLLQCRRKP